jgi:murein DD-endopeptidase MepM/ murein hydrolase activator NlpD
MKMVGLLLVVSFSACAQVVPTKSEHVIRPGEVRLIEFPVVEKKAHLNCRGNRVKYELKDNKGVALVVESYFSDLSKFQCRLEKGDTLYHELIFTVEDRQYLAEQLKVDPKKIKLSPKDQKRADEEQIVLNRIYASSLPEFLFKQPFQQPMQSLVTSIYGTKRVYNNQKKGQHLGIDYRAAIGDKVPTANRGKVVFSGDLFYTGGTVIIDHGMDVFTVYGHLSKTLVDAGQIVEQGDLIGLSGNTGRTSGPHLHWGVKIQGQYVDGMILIDETAKYFNPK